MWHLAEPERGDAPEEGMVGGQLIDLPARWWVTQDEAIEAVHRYLAHGRRDPGLVWEPDPGLLAIES
jgi:hypothetical protein